MRVVVIGAGLAGCSAAWHLAPHAQVVLLEAGTQPGAEASAQNAGMVRRMGEDPAERALALRTHEWLAAPPDGFEGASRVSGAVIALAHDRWHLHDAAAHLMARGVRVQACDRPSTLAPALEGSSLPFAWWLPDERIADSAALIAGFLRSEPQLHLKCRVTRLLRRGGRVVGVHADGTDIEADAVVLAAGAWAGQLGGRPLIPVRRSVCASAPHPLASDAHPWVWVDDAGVYARPFGNVWLVSPCDESPEPPPTSFVSAGRLSNEVEGQVVTRLQEYLPALGDVRCWNGWTGLRTFAPDRRPMLGADPDAPGLWWAAGLGGFGVTCSAAVGEAVATWIRGDSVPWLDPAAVCPGRPQPTRWPVRETGTIHEARLHRVDG